jgi:antitoxin YefM
METISYTVARKKFRETMDKVCNDQIEVLITRQNSSPVVMLSLEAYHSIMETLYLLKSPENADRLMKSIEEVERGDFTERELFE